MAGVFDKLKLLLGIGATIGAPALASAQAIVNAADQHFSRSTNTVAPAANVNNYFNLDKVHIDKTAPEDRKIFDESKPYHYLSVSEEPLKNNSIYNCIAYCYADISQLDPKGNVINFLNPKRTEVKNETHLLKFPIGQSSFASIINKEEYGNLKNFVEQTIENGGDVTLIGHSSPTSKNHRDTVANYKLSLDREKTVENALKSDLAKDGFTNDDIASHLLKIDGKAVGETNLVKQGKGAIEEDQSVEAKATSTSTKYPYHVFVADGATARASAGKIIGINTIDDKGDYLETDNEIQCHNVNSWSHPLKLPIHANDLTKLNIAIDGTRGDLAGVFNYTQNGGEVTLSLNGKPIVILDRVDGTFLNPMGLARGNIPNFVIYDADGNPHDIIPDQQIDSYFRPKTVVYVNDVEKRNADIINTLTKGDRNHNGRIEGIEYTNPDVMKCINGLKASGIIRVGDGDSISISEIEKRLNENKATADNQKQRPRDGYSRQ